MVCDLYDSTCVLGPATEPNQANAIYLELERMGESLEQLLICVQTPSDWFASLHTHSSQAFRHG